MKPIDFVLIFTSGSRMTNYLIYIFTYLNNSVSLCIWYSRTYTIKSFGTIFYVNYCSPVFVPLISFDIISDMKWVNGGEFKI